MHLIATINGSPRSGSRTAVLLQAICGAISTLTGAKSLNVDLGAEGFEILSGVSRDKISLRGEELVSLAEEADLIVIGSPIYRGSYTGIFKHYFDLVDRDRMGGGLAVLAATAASPHHALAIEHQFRPLMGFFAVQTIATAPFAIDTDFDSGRISSQELLDQVSRCAREAASLLNCKRRSLKTVGAA